MATENRQLLKQLLDFYGVASLDELDARSDPSFWSDKLWASWDLILCNFGSYNQTFDFTKPTEGDSNAYGVVEHFGGERQFYKDQDGELFHESCLHKPSGEEKHKFPVPRSENLLPDGLAIMALGPMAASWRLFAFPPTGHGSVFAKQLKWGAPIVGELVFKPNDQVRLSVFTIFTTPASPGAKGSLLRLLYWRDDNLAHPFSASTFWKHDEGTAIVRRIEKAQATTSIFGTEGGATARASGFSVRPDLTNNLRVAVRDGIELGPDALDEGGDEATFYLLPCGAILNVIQLPEQGREYAARWRAFWRLEKRLMVGIIAFNRETGLQEPEFHEYAFN